MLKLYLTSTMKRIFLVFAIFSAFFGSVRSQDKPVNPKALELFIEGNTYEALKQPSEAIKYYEKITENYQYDETVLTRMIEIYEGYKDYANVASTIEKLLSLNPTDIQLKYSAAAAYLKIPDYDNALKIY